MLLLLAGGLSAFGGLVYDAGGAVNRRAEVTDAAWALSRAAATQTVLVDGVVEIDPVRAREEVTALANEQWPDFVWVMDVGINEVTVTVRGRYEPKMLSALGWSGTDLEAVKTSETTR